jgi:DNA-binding NarL/FixJ family response regulator
MLLDAFRRLLEPRCEIVGTVSDGRSLIELVEKTRPELVVLDISMPELNGIDAAAQILKTLPGTKLIFLTVSEDPDLAAEALRMGASGFLLKSSAASELFTAIEHAMEGRKYVTSLITKGLPLGVFMDEARSPGTEKLTPRQREVLQLLSEGHAMKEVAARLDITARTVAFHKYSMMEALGLKTSTELVRYAVEHEMTGSV